MQRINSANKAVDLYGPGKHGFQAGVPSTNTPATFLTPEWCNSIQEEISRVIENFGVALDSANPGQLLQVLLANFATASANIGEIGKISYVPAVTASANHLPVFGAEVSRTTYSQLWAFAQASGALVTEAQFATRPGCFSYGPGGVGGTTFRVPRLAGLIIKAFHNGDGTYTTNTTASIGEYLPDDIKSHRHLVDPNQINSSSESGWGKIATGGQGPEGTIASFWSEFTGGPENTVRSVVLFPQIRFR